MIRDHFGTDLMNDTIVICRNPWILNVQAASLYLYDLSFIKICDKSFNSLT